MISSHLSDKTNTSIPLKIIITVKPFKEGWKSRHHSDRIGNNYCPKARDLKVRAIKRRPDPKVSTLSHKKLNEEYEARPEAPPSRPMSPTEQRRKAPARFLDSTSSDLERMKVLKRKIPTNDLEPLHEKSFQTILEKSNLRGRYEWVEKELRNEIMEEYLDATKQSILDFILLDLGLGYLRGKQKTGL